MLPTDSTLLDGYKGICRFGRFKGGGFKYHARINLNNQQRLIGPFHDAVEAAKCYDFALDFFWDNLKRKPKPYRFNCGSRAKVIETTDDTTEFRVKCLQLKAIIEAEELGGAELPTHERGEEGCKRESKVLDTSDTLKQILAVLIGLDAKIEALNKAQENSKPQVEKLFAPALPHETT